MAKTRIILTLLGPFMKTYRSNFAPDTENPSGVNFVSPHNEINTYRNSPPDFDPKDPSASPKAPEAAFRGTSTWSATRSTLQVAVCERRSCWTRPGLRLRPGIQLKWALLSVKSAIWVVFTAWFLVAIWQSISFSFGADVWFGPLGLGWTPGHPRLE